MRRTSDESAPGGTDTELGSGSWAAGRDAPGGDAGTGVAVSS